MTGPRGSHLKGVLFKVLYVATIVVMLALIKAVENVPVSEVMFFRCFFSIIPIGIWLLLRGELAGAFRTKRLSAHVSRTVVGTISMGLTFVAVQNLPLPEAVTLQYSQPLFVVALSALFIGERVGIFRWGAVVYGFLGVLVVTWPNLTMLSAGTADLSQGEIIGISAALIASAGVAVVLLLVGQLVQTEKPTTITLYFWLISSILLAMTSVTGWVSLTLQQLAILIVCGILGGLAQLFMGISLQAAQASATASFEYTSLIFATAIGFFYFGDVPRINTLVGSLMIIAAGLMIIWREGKGGAGYETAAKASAARVTEAPVRCRTAGASSAPASTSSSRNCSRRRCPLRRDTCAQRLRERR
jgi:drug/metabolite transporter (DMT)-like permease